MDPVIIVHGGAFKLLDEEFVPSEQGVRQSAQAGMAVLSLGGSAIDAVEAAVRAMEANPIFNAGLGASLTRDGKLEVDASIMDGRTKKFGAVACVPDFMHPVSLARAVMEDGEHALLGGPGALAFASEKGLSHFHRTDLVTEGALKRLKRIRSERADTVGACALDSRGGLAVAISTGGKTNKRSGRIGDTPIIGAGFYVDNSVGAAGATGDGEAIMRALLCYRATMFLKEGLSCGSAARESVSMLDRETGKKCGIIMLSPSGETGLYHNTPHMPWAIASAGTGVKSGISSEKSVLP